MYYTLQANAIDVQYDSVLHYERFKGISKL